MTEDIMGPAVALLAALHRGDVRAAEHLMSTVDTGELAGFLLGLVGQLGQAAAGSPERWADILAAWQPGQRLGDGFER